MAAPWVVMTLFCLSIAEVAFGSVWLVQMHHITVYESLPDRAVLSLLPSLSVT